MRLAITTCLVIIALVVNAQEIEIEVIKFNQLSEMITNGKHELEVYNFWATWCKPCIAELPYFEAVNNDKDLGHVKVFLISLDFVEQLDNRVKSFVARRNLTSDIKLLDETDYNAFIDKIDPSWSGAIPATLIVDNINDKKYFYEKSFEEGELETLIQNIQ